MEGMASGASSLDSAGSSDGALNAERDSGGCDSVGSPVSGPECRSDFDNIQAQYQLLRHNRPDVRRHEHSIKELEYYHKQHISAMNSAEPQSVVVVQESQQQTLVRGKYSSDQQQQQQREMQDGGKPEVIVVNSDPPGGSAEMNQRYVSVLRKYEVIQDENKALRKRCDDVCISHGAVVNKMELAEEEVKRLKKQLDEVMQERTNLIRERNGFEQQCNTAMHQWYKALGERNEYHEVLTKVSQQHEEAVKEINKAVVDRMKANKDIKRLTEERNAALHEYSLIMSERDTVHQEMETLNNEVSQAYAKIAQLENENKQLLEEKKTQTYQVETLRREISSALHDRDEALKECNELRQKFGDFTEASNRERNNRLELHSYSTERDSASKEAEKESSNPRDYKHEKGRMDNLEQANAEIERLRKYTHSLESDLEEAVQEAEVSKRRRDWAFSERDKIVLERESIRNMCERLRKERDRAVSELGSALAESDDMKKRRNEASKELKELKEKLAESGDQRATAQYAQQHDSDSEWDALTVHLDAGRRESERDLGLMLVGGRDNPYYPDDTGVYVAQVVPGSVVDSKLRVNDCILRVNNVDCSAVSTRAIMDSIRSCSGGPAVLTIRRRRRPGRRSLRTTQLPVGSVPHGITLEIGIYIARISPGSLAAKDGYLAVGDRVLNINSKSMERIATAHEAMAILNDASTDVLTITTLKGLPVAEQDLSSEAMPMDASFSPEKQKMVNSCSQTEQERMMLKSMSSDYERHCLDTAMSTDRSVYKVSKSMSSDKPSGISNAWDNIREKIDIVRGRRHSKDREEKKKRHKNSSPNTFEQEQDAIAKLDSVIESYHKKTNGGGSGVLKRSKRRGVGTSGTTRVSGSGGADKPAADKNGGTWPKARIGPLIQNGTGTILHPRKTKERLPLSVLLSNPPKYESAYNYNRISNPIPLANFSSGGTASGMSTSSNRHTVYKALESSPLPSFPKSTQLHAQRSFVPSAVQLKTSLDVAKSSDPSDFSTKPSRELDFCGKSNKRGASVAATSKYTPLGHDAMIDPLAHNRVHSQLYSVPARVVAPPGGGNFSFPPYTHSHHHHQQSVNANSRFPSSLPSAQSGESIGLPDARSFCFEPPYSPQPNFAHLHTPSVDLHYHKPRAHPSMGSYELPPYVSHVEGGTFPRKKESQRFRIPSNPSVTSKSSIGKLSSGSIEKTSERGSPMPTFHVEIISPGMNPAGGRANSRINSKRSSMPDYCYAQYRPTLGQVRRIQIEKSQEPLGIQISCLESGGVFVSSVTDQSLASQVGLQIGDQLLDVCGINMRTCDSYEVAANILRQCGNSFTMLVQYSPDKYSELEGSGSSSESDGNGEKEASHSGSSTPCNSPEASRKSTVEPLESSEPERDQCNIPTIRAPKERERDRDRELRASASVEVRGTQEREREIRNSASLDINIRKPELRTSVTLDGIRNSISGTATLTRGQLSQGGTGTLQRQNATVRSPTQEEQNRSKTLPSSEPRYLYIETRKCSNLGISLVGGNGVGIFVHSVQPGCLAEEAGLFMGDRILEYNGVDLRQATAEQAALELARPADKVTLIAQYMIDRYNEVKDKPGDSFYVKAMFDRVSELGEHLQLKFSKDDVLYVDNTMFNGTPGHWRAWLISETGERLHCGIIPSKFKVEEELLLRRSLGDLETGENRRAPSSARRSFFRRKKHHRSSSRDSKELSHITSVNMGWYSDSGTLNEENLPLSYQRVERLDYPAKRPILIIGPLNECVSAKLTQEIPGKFIRCVPEVMHCSQATLEQGLRDSQYVDYRKKGNYFECTTVQAVKQICEKKLHCILDISLASLERLHRHMMYPIVLLIKFKSTKQIKEVKDSRYPSDKVSAKAAKEMYEQALKLESEYRQFINIVIPAGVNIASICTQVEEAVDEEQSKALWIPRGLP